MKPRSIQFALVAICCLTLAACSSGGSDSDTKPPSESLAEAPATGTVDAPSDEDIVAVVDTMQCSTMERVETTINKLNAIKPTGMGVARAVAWSRGTGDEIERAIAQYEGSDIPSDPIVPPLGDLADAFHGFADGMDPTMQEPMTVHVENIEAARDAVIAVRDICQSEAPA